VAFMGTRDTIKDEWQSYDGSPLPLRNLVGGRNPTELRRRSAETRPAPVKGADGTYGGRDYRIQDDKYPPNNRTLENFFRGAWTYHIHNQWLKHPQPNSWFDVIQRAQDGFFRGERTNPYGERWEGPEVGAYERWPEFD